MRVYGYTRCEDQSAASKARKDMRGWCHERKTDLIAFSWDGKSGQRGIRSAMRSLGHGDGECDTLLVRDIADIGRDLVSLVKILQALLTLRVGVEVVTGEFSLMAGDQTTGATRLAIALFKAHTRYVSEARRHGIETARANGATIGRPRGITLEDVQEDLRRLMNANKGEMPSVRKVATALTAAGKKCSTGTAAKLIRQFNSTKAELGWTEAKEETDGKG